MSTTTTHYGWVQPTPGGDPTTWGTELNTDLGLIDGQVWANQQAGAPVGSIIMFGGGSAPANWLLCNGAAISRTTYATLFGVIQTSFGAGDGSTTFNLPLFNGRFPVGAYGFSVMGATGGEANHTLSTAEMPAHAHPVEQTPHGHGVNDPTHTHGISDPTHTHGVNQTPHSHTGILRPTGANTHAAAGSADSAMASTDGAIVGISIGASSTGIAISGAATGVTIASAYANINGNTTDNVGGGGAHNNMPPYLGVNFIIRAT